MDRASPYLHELTGGSPFLLLSLNPAEALPWEIFTVILSLLPTADLRQCMQVCTVWNQASNDNFVRGNLNYTLLSFMLSNGRFGMPNARNCGQINTFQRYFASGSYNFVNCLLLAYSPTAGIWQIKACLLKFPGGFKA